MSHLTQDQLHELAKALSSVSVADLIRDDREKPKPSPRYILERTREFVISPSNFSDVERNHLIDGITRIIETFDK